MCPGNYFVPNRRLFFGGIPKNKTRDEIWKGLTGEGIHGIVNVIVYKSYSKYFLNRGYVFVEFESVKEAKMIKAKFSDKLRLFGKKIVIDWTNPTIDSEPEELLNVKKLFIRNLPVTMTRNQLVQILSKVLPDMKVITKIYKFKDYSFVHFDERKDAEDALFCLRRHFKEDIEVMWAKPRLNFINKYEDTYSNVWNYEEVLRSPIPSSSNSECRYSGSMECSIDMEKNKYFECLGRKLMEQCEMSETPEDTWRFLKMELEKKTLNDLIRDLKLT